MGKATKNLIMEMKDSYYYSITMTVYILVFIVAFFVRDLGQVMSFLGTSTAILLSYILPSLFYLKLYSMHPHPFTRNVCYVLIFLGTVFFFMSTYHFISNVLL